MRLIFLFLVLASQAFAVGTVTVARSPLYKGTNAGDTRVGETVTISWTADAAAATIPNTNVVLRGTLLKAVTNPGSTAPTANYDIAFGDPSDSALDALATALKDRHTSTTEQAYPSIAGTPGTVSAFPVYLNGTYVFSVSNNSVNSATGVVVLYLLDPK